MGLPGLQQPVPLNLLEQILANYDRLEERVRELERLQQPPAHYLFKPFGEDLVEEGTLTWTVPKDVDGLRLEIVEGSLVDAGSSDTEIEVNNLTQSIPMLFANLFINSGFEHSDDSAPEVEIDHTTNQVFWRDKVQMEIVGAGSGATGLGITLGFV